MDNILTRTVFSPRAVPLHLRTRCLRRGATFYTVHGRQPRISRWKLFPVSRTRGRRWITRITADIRLSHSHFFSIRFFCCKCPGARSTRLKPRKSFAFGRRSMSPINYTLFVSLSFFSCHNGSGVGGIAEAASGRTPIKIENGLVITRHSVAHLFVIRQRQVDTPVDGSCGTTGPTHDDRNPRWWRCQGARWFQGAIKGSGGAAPVKVPWSVCDLIRLTNDLLS